MIMLAERAAPGNAGVSAPGHLAGLDSPRS